MSDDIVLTIPDLRVGATWRGTARRQVDKARARGADVTAAEQWRFFGSRFTITATGTAHQIAPLVGFAALADPNETWQVITQPTHEE